MKSRMVAGVVLGALLWMASPSAATAEVSAQNHRDDRGRNCWEDRNHRSDRDHRRGGRWDCRRSSCRERWYQHRHGGSRHWHRYYECRNWERDYDDGDWNRRHDDADWHGDGHGDGDWDDDGDGAWDNG